MVLLGALFVGTLTFPVGKADDPTWFVPGRYFEYRIVTQTLQPTPRADVFVATLTVIAVNATHVTMRSVYGLANGSAASDITYDVLRSNRSVVQLGDKTAWLWVRTEETGLGAVPRIGTWMYAWTAMSPTEHTYQYSDAFGNTSTLYVSVADLWMTRTTNHVFDRTPAGALEEAWSNSTLSSTAIGPNPGPTPPFTPPQVAPDEDSGGGGGSSRPVDVMQLGTPSVRRSGSVVVESYSVPTFQRTLFGGGPQPLNHFQSYVPPWGGDGGGNRTIHNGWWCGWTESHNTGWQNRQTGLIHTDAEAIACDFSGSRRDHWGAMYGPGAANMFRFTLPVAGNYRFTWHWELNGWRDVRTCFWTPFSQCGAEGLINLPARVYSYTTGVAVTPQYNNEQCHQLSYGGFPYWLCTWSNTHVDTFGPSSWWWVNLPAGDYYFWAYVDNINLAAVSGWGDASARGHVDGRVHTFDVLRQI